jgi:hypothetical protein
MFYSTQILNRKGPLGLVWIAAHLDRQLKRGQITSANISDSVETLLHPEAPLALRLSGQLLLGVVRIYARKVRRLGSPQQAAGQAGGMQDWGEVRARQQQQQADLSVLDQAQKTVTTAAETASGRQAAAGSCCWAWSASMHTRLGAAAGLGNHGSRQAGNSSRRGTCVRHQRQQ